MDTVRLIQQKVPIGSKACFTLKNGKEISGILVEISHDYITLESNGWSSTIFIEMIGAFAALDRKTQYPDEVVKRGAEQHDSISDDPITISSKSQTDVSNKLFEIETRYSAYIKTAKLELRPPDFIVPANDRLKGKNVLNIWNRIKDKYEYACKINELGEKFGRIQPLITDLKNLSEQFPDSAFLKARLGYFYFLTNKGEEALKCFKDAASLSGDVSYWYNLAALSLQNQKKELSCYSMEQVFNKIALSEDINAWYVYVGLLKEFNNYSAIVRLLEKQQKNFSDNENLILLETGVYLLKVNNKKSEVTEIIEKWIKGEPLRDLALNAFKQLSGIQSESYQALTNELLKFDKEVKKKVELKKPPQPKGYIESYKEDRRFGFLKDLNGNEYFFHVSAIIDDGLSQRLNTFREGDKIAVIFEIAQNPTGRKPIAIQISLPRSADELFEIAKEYANSGEYSKAIAQLKRVLALAPDYPNAQDLLDKWREYALLISIPKGSNPFARAKRAQLVEKDLEKAVNLFKESIKHNDNAESAVKDLAMLLVQLGRNKEAIDVISQNQKKVKNPESLNTLLIQVYQKADLHEKALGLLQKRLATAINKDTRIQILWQIAKSYLSLKDYSNAEKIFKQVLNLNPENIAAQRNIALCLSQQGYYDKAVKILNEIVDIDGKSAELLETLASAKATGESDKVDEIIIYSVLSDFSIELSGFTKFFLDRCNFEGIAPDRVRDGKYIGSDEYAKYDIKGLEDFARQLGTRRPRERSNYYLSAARIVFDLEKDRNSFYKYLCRSFASRGDAAIVENRHLDTAREWYLESLCIYDGVRSEFDEQDAGNALVRFLFSTLGQAQIPLTPKIPPIDETIEKVINIHPQRDKVFDFISFIGLHSQYAAKRVFASLYNKSTLQSMALEYLKNQDITIPPSITHLKDFVELWNELRRRKIIEIRDIKNELQFMTNIQLTTTWLENSIERLKNILHKPFFDLDQQRLSQLQNILENLLELCSQVSFEEQERLCIQISNRCHEMLKEIESSPTRLSVEQIYPIFEVLQEKIKKRLNDLYETSKPQLEIRLALESYVPDSNNQIEVQIVVANKIGRSPAESLELVIQPSEDFFREAVSEIKLVESLSGGKQKISKIPLCVSEQALQSQTFSLGLYAQYRTRSGEIEQTSVENFSIRLYSEKDFEEIENPYAVYAESGVVEDPAMFYGRDELIQNIANTIKKSHPQSKSVIIFGQKRAGKSSILFHLKNLLREDKNILIIDLGNIGSILDEHSQIPLLYQILWSILRKLQDSIEDRIACGYTPLNLPFLSDREFYTHPSPLSFFKDFFDKYKRQLLQYDDWHNSRIVLMIDEFSYIYNFIVSGKIPESFMKNWKALLQENYFSAVLAGQDVMPRFKQQFPNEFGTTQDERVTYLNPDDAKRLIDEPIRIGGRHGESRYREKAIQRILDLTAGSPYYIQIICNRLVEYMNRKHARLITEADIEQVKNELIKGVNSLDKSKFDNLVNSGDTSRDAIADEDALKVLKEIAINSKTGPCHRGNICCETNLSIDYILDDLVKRDVIERERGHYYQIRVGLFREWIIANR